MTEPQLPLLLLLLQELRLSTKLHTAILITTLRFMSHMPMTHTTTTQSLSRFDQLELLLQYLPRPLLLLPTRPLLIQQGQSSRQLQIHRRYILPEELLLLHSLDLVLFMKLLRLSMTLLLTATHLTIHTEILEMKKKPQTLLQILLIQLPLQMMKMHP